MFTFFRNNKLISKHQSGFIPGDSTINQLLSITTEIFENFEKFRETRAVFLDISKAFDKVWYEGLLFKLKQNGIDNNLLNLIESFLTNRFQRVVLNGIESDWASVHSGVPQGSVLGPLLFLIYINDLTDNISSTMKLYADDSSLFIKVKNIAEAHSLLSTDLAKISDWAHTWKMQFNPDITKQAIEIIFSNKYKKDDHPPLTFGEIPVARKDSTKHIGFQLDEKLDFKLHVSESITKANMGIALLKYLSKYLNRNKLELAYKLHVRPLLEYGDIIFHDRSLYITKTLESIQYQAALAVSGCWNKTSRLKLYMELGWESLADRRMFHRLTSYYKIKNNIAPNYLSEHCLTTPPPPNASLRYKNSFFPSCFMKWEGLDPLIKNSVSVSSFKSKYLKKIRPPRKNTYNIRDRRGLSLLTRMRVEHSDLREHRYHHNFNCPSPICACNSEIESPEHYFLRCPRYARQRSTLLANLEAAVNSEFLNLPHDHLTKILLYGSNAFNDITNKIILETSIHFIKCTGRFKKIEAYATPSPTPSSS